MKTRKCYKRRMLTGLFLMGVALIMRGTAHAGCGCDKPPPKPAALIPGVAYPGLGVTLYSQAFQTGQVWAVRFTSGSSSAVVAAKVVNKRNITDPTGKTYSPQLVVTVPDITPGPTSVQATMGTLSLVVPKSSFVVTGHPVALAELQSENDLLSYAMAAGTSGTLYVPVAGLGNVCAPMEIDAYLPEYPLRFGFGQVVIVNWQGYFIDTLDATSANHVAFTPGDNSRSDQISYFRHSFEKYCHDHLPGGPKQVNPNDPNWHLDGTPHVDYSALFFEISGLLNGVTKPTPGTVAQEAIVETMLPGPGATWEVEQDEE
jgi:hypothetical protein